MNSVQHGLLDRLDHETWLIKRLGEHGAHVLDGVTDEAARKQRIREAILANHLSSVLVGNPDGKNATYAQAFARLYGEPLTVGA